MCEIFALLLVLMIPIALLVVIVDASMLSQARKKAKLFILGKKKPKVRIINKIIDDIRFTSTKKERKHIPEKDRHLIEQLRKIRDSL